MIASRMSVRALFTVVLVNFHPCSSWKSQLPNAQMASVCFPRMYRIAASALTVVPPPMLSGVISSNMIISSSSPKVCSSDS